MSTSSDPSQNPETESSGVSRREFLLRTGAAGALIAGSAVAGLKLWQPNHFVPGFETEKGLQLPDLPPAGQRPAEDGHRPRRDSRQDHSRRRWRARRDAAFHPQRVTS